MKKPFKRGQSRPTKKGKRQDLEDAAEISAEETDEDNLDKNMQEESKEVAEVSVKINKA